jgi:hypothetical protein
MGFNVTFNNISSISWRCVLLWLAILSTITFYLFIFRHAELFTCIKRVHMLKYYILLRTIATERRGFYWSTNNVAYY